MPPAQRCMNWRSAQEVEMSDQEELKQHFAQRVIHQAREVLEVWQQVQRNEWNASYHAALAEANQRLQRFAERFEQAEHQTALAEANQRLQRFAERFEQAEHHQLALEIEDCLEDIDDNRGRLSSEIIATLSQLIYRLARTGLQNGD